MKYDSVRQLKLESTASSLRVSIILSSHKRLALLSEALASLETQLQIFNPERP